MTELFNIEILERYDNLNCFKDSEIRRMESELIIKHDSLWPNGYNMTSETRGGTVRKGK